MMLRISGIFIVAFASLLLIANSYAGEVDMAKMKETVVKMTGMEPTEIVKTPVQGIYEVTIPPRVIYISDDARYVFAGSIFDSNTEVNLTEEKTSKARIAALEKMGESSMIVFKPKKETKYTISVFTDIDCGYCRKLHSEIDNYTDLGIKVRYLAFPRAGLGSESYKKAVAVWCAKDRNKALTEAKKGGKIKFTECENPVKEQMILGHALGVNGTPAIMLENGQIYPGYAPADKLVKVLDQVKSDLVAAR